MKSMPHAISWTRVLLAALACASAFAPAAAADLTGEQIYKQKCASCHGASGEGVKGKYDDPLIGDRTPAQLAKQIARTMPEDKPGTCVGVEADRVAAYIHEAFYSLDAQARNKPPRVELSRLTVSQYRNALADLIAGFRPAPEKWDGPRGLKGEYFDSRGFNKMALTRTDAEVKFDFKTATPDEKLKDPDQFSIRWTGGVLAPETGTYEFLVRTDHALRLYVNDTKTALIDAYVKSGTDTEYKGSIYLVAGRVYPIKLEFLKAKQGVDDSKKGKPKPPTKPAMIALEWKPPHGTLGLVPRRNLSPNKFPEQFVCDTSFPPDDRSLGWERGTRVSKEWDSAITESAVEAAGYVAAKLNELAGSKDPVKVKAFAEKFVSRAFRKPLASDEKAIFVDRQFEAAKDPELAVKRVVILTLLSPRFLYREVNGEDPYAVASRLAFMLWDAPPDDVLLKAAAEGKLATREQVAAQAERMLADMKGRAKLQNFLHTWLKLDQAHDMAKDPKRFPGFDPAIISDLRTSLDLFLDDVIWSPTSDFRKLLTSDEIFLNDRLAKFYGTKADGPEFQKVKLDAGRRAGAITHPYLMANFSYTGTTSPIHRGVFLARGVLGMNLRPPQEAFTPLDENLHPTLTTRERVALQTKGAACQACHITINSLGFTLENFDAVGRFREKDNNKPVDATGSYLTEAGETKSFKNAREMALFLAGCEDTHEAFVEQMFHHLVKQPVRAYGLKKLDEMRAKFAKDEYNIRKLAVEIATTAAMKQ